MTSEVYISSHNGQPKDLERSAKEQYNFALINGGSAFFLPVQSGWNNRCRELNVNCHYWMGDNATLCDVFQIGILGDLAAAKLGDKNHNFTQPNSNVVVDGIAIGPCGTELDNITTYVIEEAGIPVIAFDTDMPDVPTSAYVGTDNDFMGVTMANVVKQLRPEGGTFSIAYVLDKPNVVERTEGFRREITKDNDREGKAKWHEIAGLDEGATDIAALQPVADQNPDVFAIMYQTPMRSENWTSFVDYNRHRNISIVATDASEVQIDYLNRRYVDGLVGQLPYDFGAVSADVLLELTKSGGKLPKTFYATNLVSFTLIPLELPELDLDENLLGNWVIMGYTAVALVMLTGLACIGWTIWYREEFVVRASQPFFLIMVATGIIVLISALIPLSFDDGGDIDSLNDSERIAMCMSIPWLAFTGFAVTFSALFSKTWRINRVFQDKRRHVRTEVRVRDVLAPFVVLLTSNIIVLTCWTVIDPLMYSREEHDGTDYWKRVISTYGTCRSENVAPYLIPLAVINFVMVCIAVWEAYQARGIQSEFAETKYIGLVMSSIFQGFLTGVPILVLVKDDPEAFYLVLTLMLFLLSMAVLLLIFLPKYFMRKKYSGMPEAEQRRLIAEGIRKSSVGREQQSSGSGSSFPMGTNDEQNHSSKKFVVPKKVLDMVPEYESVLSDDRRAIHENPTSQDQLMASSRNYVSSLTLESRNSYLEPTLVDSSMPSFLACDAPANRDGVTPLVVHGDAWPRGG